MKSVIPDTLARWLHDNVSPIAGPATWSRFEGGRSNPTYRIDAPAGRYVLRRQPEGMLSESAHAVDREFRLIDALRSTAVPVPRAIALCTDRSVLGGMFYVMELVDGDIHWSGLLPDFDVERRHALHLAQISVLARLHKLDWVAAGLSNLSRSGSYVARQLDRWTRQLASATGLIHGDLLPLADALGRSLPTGEEKCLVHGDYRIDNMIFRSGCAEVAAVIDWELATVGDPLVDLTYFLIAWLLPAKFGGMGGVHLEALGVPSIEQAVSWYAAATGRPTIPALDWYMAFNLFRVAAMCEGILERVRTGTVAPDRAADIAERIEPLVFHARAYARGAGI